jgi:hypothetical protein|tara:strand:- start:720 stop:1079 length:360 start_codon:yes stop_codon:yes gene_type:complete
MAYFVELDQNNIVLRVVVVDDEHEQDGITWCENFYNGGIWLQTSYTGAIRKDYAGIGDTYDPELDSFYGPKLFPSWVLNEEGEWEAPTPCPNLNTTQADHFYLWDEDSLTWKRHSKPAF